MWVRFLRAYDWSPAKFGGRLTQAHQPGNRLVPRACGEEAIAAGAAVEITRDDYHESRATDGTDAL